MASCNDTDQAHFWRQKLGVDGSGGGHGMGSSKAPGYLHHSFRGRGSAIQMLLTNLLQLGRKSCWRGGSTAFRQLSEVKYAPAQVSGSTMHYDW